MKSKFLSVAVVSLLIAAFPGKSSFAQLIGTDPLPSSNKVQTKPADDLANNASIQWIDSVQTFKKIKEGEKVNISFRFRNTGKVPLTILTVRPGCGCTIAEKPEAPIAPGKEGVIKGSFDSEGKPGHIRKSIYVTANTQNIQSHELVFEGEVTPKAKQQ
jgi:Protein of unknown function (DUF1573)